MKNLYCFVIAFLFCIEMIVLMTNTSKLIFIMRQLGLCYTKLDVFDEMINIVLILIASLVLRYLVFLMV